MTTNPANTPVANARPFEVYNRNHRFVDELRLTPDAYRTLASLGMRMSPVLDTDEEAARWLDAAAASSVDGDALRAQAAEAIMREWKRHAIVCEHTQLVEFGGLAAAADSVYYPMISRLIGERSQARHAYTRTIDRLADALGLDRENPADDLLLIAVNAIEERERLRAELTNAQQAYSRTFDRMATIENEEQGR